MIDRILIVHLIDGVVAAVLLTPALSILTTRSPLSVPVCVVSRSEINHLQSAFISPLGWFYKTALFRACVFTVGVVSPASLPTELLRRSFIVLCARRAQARQQRAASDLCFPHHPSRHSLGPCGLLRVWLYFSYSLIYCPCRRAPKPVKSRYCPSRLFHLSFSSFAKGNEGG